MKKTIRKLIIAAAATVAVTQSPAQLQTINLTALSTNITVTSAILTVPGYFTNSPYTASNHNNVTVGDSWNTAMGKVNSNFAWCSNQFVLMVNLPNQINTNLASYIGGVSNMVVLMNQTNAWIIAHVATNHGSGYVFSNGWFSGDGTWLIVQGTNIVNNTINSNAFDWDTLTWLQSCIVPGAHMNFDSGNISSDGSGDANFVSIYSQRLKDSGGWDGSGSSGYFAQANGSGGWSWTAWPSSLSYDSGQVTSDGSGNISAVSFRGGFYDAGWSTGTAGYVPTANGDGTWNWQPGGSGGTASVQFTNTLTLAAGASAYVTNWNGIAGVFQLAIPQGLPGTNFVTAFAFSNQVLSSQQLTTYMTNNAYWRASNFLARVNGLYRWTASGGNDGGNDGGNPPFNIPIYLTGSYTGTNGWFTLTNGFQTTNWISVALLTNGLSAMGGRQVGPGGAALYSIDHWELLGRTNYFFGQHQRFDSPLDSADAATKAYVDGGLANLTAAFPFYTDSNQVYHTVYTVAGVGIFDTPQTTVLVPVVSTAVDGTGTNFLMSVIATNLTGGWKVQTTTNLSLLYSWTTWTNYTTNIVSGTNTFTIPFSPATPCQFFRVLKSSSSGFTVNPPITASAGTIYPSNTWNLAAITNAMPNFSIWQGNSNGCCLVTLSLSNGVVRYLQALR